VERAGLQRRLSELGAEGGARETKEALAAAAKAMHGPRPARGTQGGMRAGLRLHIVLEGLRLERRVARVREGMTRH
jgi:hypothetical protein